VTGHRIISCALFFIIIAKAYLELGSVTASKEGNIIIDVDMYPNNMILI